MVMPMSATFEQRHAAAAAAVVRFHSRPANWRRHLHE